MHTILHTSVDSSNSAMPSNAVPVVPTPVHTAYAVPSGSVRNATPSNARLITIEATVPMVGHRRENPSVNFRPTAQPISNIPAQIRTTQAISNSMAGEEVAPRLSGQQGRPCLEGNGRSGCAGKEDAAIRP